MLEFNPLQLEDLPKLRDYFGYTRLFRVQRKPDL